MNGVKFYFYTTVETWMDYCLQAGRTRQLEPHPFLQHQRLWMLPFLQPASSVKLNIWLWWNHCVAGNFGICQLRTSHFIQCQWALFCWAAVWKHYLGRHTKPFSKTHIPGCDTSTSVCFTPSLPPSLNCRSGLLEVKLGSEHRSFGLINPKWPLLTVNIETWPWTLVLDWCSDQISR